MLSRIQEKIHELGSKKTLGLILIKFKTLLSVSVRVPEWLLFKAKIFYLNREINNESSGENQVSFDSPFNKEQQIRELLSSRKNISFLEVGIGERPNIERIRLQNENDVKYTGCDFAAVCELHKKQLDLYGMRSEGMVYIGNEVGTYSWSMFELVKSGERFDLIYIDGHHTFYVDLPAIFLADMLLEEGGHLLIDDVKWNLDLMKKNMLKSVSQYAFYRDVYNFKQYTKEQARVCHVEEIADHVLIQRMGYQVVEQRSSEDWWVLRKAGS